MSTYRPWFKFWIDDWQTSETVRCASWGARGVYVEMLCYQWREGSLPREPARIARLVGCPVKLVQEILTAFPEDECGDGRRRNPKMEAVREDAEEISQKARAAANARWGRNADASLQRNADASVSHMPKGCHPEPRTQNPDQGNGTGSPQGCGTCVPQGEWAGWNPRTRKICPCPLGNWRRSERKAGRLSGGRPSARAIAGVKYECPAGCGMFEGWPKWSAHLDDAHGGKAPDERAQGE